MERLLIGLGVVAGVIIVALLVVNYLLTPYGLTVFDVITILFNSFSSSASLQSFDSISSEDLGEEVYNQLRDDRIDAINTVESWRADVEDVNNDPEMVSAIKAEFGEEFTLYMFSYYYADQFSFKVFEWTMSQENGLITVFEEGMPESYDATVELNNELVIPLLEGELTEDELLSQVKQGNVKIIPITMLSKAVSLFQRFSSTS